MKKLRASYNLNYNRLDISPNLDENLFDNYLYALFDLIYLK